MIGYKTPAQIFAENAEAQRIVRASDPGNRHGRADMANPAKAALPHETPMQFRRRCGDLAGQQG